MASKRPATPHPRVDRERSSSSSSSSSDSSTILADDGDQALALLTVDEVRARVASHLSRCFMRARSLYDPSSRAFKDDENDGWRELAELKFILRAVIMLPFVESF